MEDGKKGEVEGESADGIGEEEYEEEEEEVAGKKEVEVTTGGEVEVVLEVVFEVVFEVDEVKSKEITEDGCCWRIYTGKTTPLLLL